MTCLTCTMELPTRDVFNKTTSISRLVNRGCDFFGYNFEYVYNPSKKIKFCEPRHMIIYVIYKNTNYTYEQIGNFFSGRDHTYSRYAVTKSQNKIDTEDKFRNTCEELKAFIFN